MLAVPTGKVVVVNLAFPALSVPDPNAVVPFINFTVPVGVPLNCGSTVAVNVTDCPNLDGFSDDPTVIVVVAGKMTWLTAVDVLGANDESPE